MEELRYWIWLSQIEKLGSIRIQKLLEKYNDPKEIWKLTKEDLLKIDLIGSKVADEILNEKYRYNLRKIENKMKEERNRTYKF